MVPPDPTRLAFDDVVIDFAGRRLLCAGVEQPLEPKAFAVLALLAGTPGRVFTRDEILDAVWGHRHVTPGVLNRVMTLLRHALGEDAQSPRRLHTLHGVGYRFDLPVLATAVSHPEPEPPLEPATIATTEATGTPVPRRRSDDVDTPKQEPRSRRWRLPALGALVVLALAASILLSFRHNDATTPASPAPPTPRPAAPALVVLPLKAIGADAGGQSIADGLSEELISSLAQIDGLRVIAHASTRLAVAESADPTQLVQRLGISHALEGSLQQSGEHLRIRLRLVEAANGRTLWIRDFDRDAPEALTLQREIAEAVATALALRMGLAAGPPGTTGDAEYLRRYLAAQSLLRQTGFISADAAENAEAEFRALLRQRPDDARARAGLLMALHFRAYRRPDLAEALRAEIAQEAVVVQRLDPMLYESWFVQATQACRTNDWERCLGLLQKARALSPSSTSPPHAYYGYALLQLGFLDRGEAVHREILASDPINPVRNFNLARTLDTQGRHEEALAHFDPGNPFHVYSRWFNAVWRRDYVTALQIAEHEIGANPRLGTSAGLLKPSYVATSLALTDPSLWPQAEEEMRKFEQATGLLNFNRVLAPDAPARAAELIAKLDVLRKRSYSTWDLLLWTKGLPWLRRDPAFQDYLRDNGILAYWKAHGFPAQCRPQGEGAACD